MLLACWLLLLAVLLIWWLSRVGGTSPRNSVAGVLLLLPLAGFLPAILGGSQQASAAASLLLIPYIGWGLTEAVANPEVRVLAAATVFAGMACFAVLILWLRILRSP